METREYRRFGRTDLLVSTAGLGTEYLHGKSADVVTGTLQKARELGVNYLDILFSYAPYRENLAKAIVGERDQWVLAVHLGCAESDGQYRNTRDLGEIRASFEDFLNKFATDHADVLMIQMVDSEQDFNAIMAPGGVYELAEEYIKAGQAKAIGLSSHVENIAWKAATSGKFDAIMYPYNAAGRSAEPRLLEYCQENGITFVAMKPFAGGRLVKPDNEGYQLMTPAECIGFVLSTPGVTTCVPGAASAEHMLENATAIPGYDLPPYADPAVITAKVKELGQGDCIYCGHCEPCSAKISIPRILELVDGAEWGVQPGHIKAYQAMDIKASECVACGNCEERCPYGVAVIKKMKKAVELFTPS